jgi:hypothetical protein
MESPGIAAKLELYSTLITLELLMNPESSTTPVTPPTLGGKVHMYPIALDVSAAVYLYTLAPHTLLTNVCVILVGAKESGEQLIGGC